MSFIKNNLFNLSFLAALAFALFSLNSCQKKGCTDPNAFNFDPQATKDDGSCIYPPGGSSGGTTNDTIDENITANTTISQNTYLCKSTVYISADVVIEPGVTLVMCSGAQIEIQSGGSLKAQGTSSNPITFTGEVKTEGFWEGIEFNSNNPDNILEYATIEYAGSNDWSIWMQNSNNAQLTMKNCTLQYSGGYGIHVESGGTSLPGFSNNVFQNNQKAGIYIPHELVHQLDNSSTYDANNNGENYIEVHKGSTPSTDQNWSVTSAPYFFSQSSTYYFDGNVTIEPGVTALMGSGTQIEITSNGSISAIGTSGNYITFTGKNKSAGYWDLIEINSNSASNEFKYVELAYGGSGNSSTIWIQNSNNGRLKMTQCKVHDNYTWGLYVESGGTTIEPTDSASIVNQNDFSNNGLGSSAGCQSPCHVKIE